MKILVMTVNYSSILEVYYPKGEPPAAKKIKKKLIKIRPPPRSPTFRFPIIELVLPRKIPYDIYMMKEEALKRLKEQLRAVEADIDRIVLTGGRVGLGDPLTREAQAIRTKIGKLVQATPTWSFNNTAVSLR